MANVLNGNTFYINESSDSGTGESYIDKKGVKVIGILAFSDATTDTIKIYDKASGSAAAGALKLSLDFATAKDEHHFDLSGTPILFPNGIWVALTGSPEITLIIQN